VVFPMNEVESLNNSFGVSEGCQDYHYMENLMARTNEIESSPTPSLRNLEGISHGAREVQSKSLNNPQNSHPLALYIPPIFVYSM